MRLLGIAVLVAAVVGIGRGVADAQVNPAAEQAFRDGKRLMTERRFGEACDAFATSQRLEPNIATLMSLADCREKNGQLASAWSLFLEAEQKTRNVADQSDLHATADARSIAIEPRLSYLTINVPDESRLKGLVVMRNSEAVDPGLWNRAVPVDGGSFRVEAKAPGHETWSTEVTVAAEKDRQAIEVPRFKDLPAMVGRPTEVDPPSGPAERRRGGMTQRRRLGMGLAAVSAPMLGLSAVLWSQAKGLEDDALALCTPTSCTQDQADGANALNDDARQRAMFSNVALGAGVVALSAGAYFWFTGAPTGGGVAIVPQVGAVTGIAATGAF